MKVAIQRAELRDFIKEIILYGKFYGIKVCSRPFEEFLGSGSDNSFTLALNNNVVTVILFIQYWLGSPFEFWQFTIKIDLPEEKCLFCKKYAEMMKKGDIKLNVKGYKRDLLGVLIGLSLCEELQSKSDERRNEFAEVYASSSFVEFVEYLFNRAMIPKSKSAEVRIECVNELVKAELEEGA